MRKLKVISLFDGMACGYLSLNRSQLPVDTYFASEIDKWAIMVSSYNNPSINHLGDVCRIIPEDFREMNIDMVMGGSPCQSISISGNSLGITTNDGQIVDSLTKYRFLKEVMGYSYDKEDLKYFNTSCLFWEYVRILRGIQKYNPDVKFFLENVVNPEWGQLISNELGVQPYQINSSMVSPQNRDRYYWTNIEYTPIEYNGYPLLYLIPDSISGAGTRGGRKPNKSKTTVRKDGLANCLTTSSNTRKYLSTDGTIKPIPIDHAERLQNVPVGYTNVPGVSLTQRFKMLGNGWTIDVISHFFNCLKAEIKRKDLRFARTTIQIITPEGVLTYN